MALTNEIKDTVTSSDVDELRASEGGPCFSVYFSATEYGADPAKGPVYLRELANEVNDLFWKAGVDSGDADELIASLDDLSRETAFWQSGPIALAIFRSLDGALAVFKLPVAVEKKVSVGEAFDLDQLESAAA